MSSSGLTAAFRRATGLPPKRYLTTMRMRRATTLLEGTDHTVAEVARMVGYDNPLYFSRLYRSYTGLPPSAAKRG